MDNEAKRKAAALFRRIHSEVADDLDEEMELELDDDRVADTIDGVIDHRQPPTTTTASSISASCCGCSAS